MGRYATSMESDLLCIGGGIAGLMAAIRAAESGLSVIVAEKSDSRYSGAGASGNDHFQCYIPEYHGNDIDACIAELQSGQQKTIRSMKFIRTWMERSYEVVRLWDEWGIPMKYNGHWEFAGHGMPGDKLNHLHYAGKNQKLVLTEQAVKRGVRIINRVMCYDILRDEQGACGALGINTRTGEHVTFRAKAVFCGTGATMRLYPSATPANLFNTKTCPNNTGDGRAMAYRAGAEIASLEMPHTSCGPTYFVRGGKATWGGVLRYPSGRPAGPFVTRPDNKYGDPVCEIYQNLLIDCQAAGTGPIYMDCTGLNQEEVDYMCHWLDNENNTALLDELKREGIDIGTTPFEFRPYDHERNPHGGILYDHNARTSLPGLYAGGDEFHGGISCAAVFGMIAGESAAADCAGASLRLADEETEITQLIDAFRTRPGGSRSATWQEVNHAVQQIMNDYAGAVRSETLLVAGLEGLTQVEEKARASLAAANPHELARCVEVLNLMEVGKLLFCAARERKESRGKQKRTDYPFTHPKLNKLLVFHRENGVPVSEWRSVGK